MVALAILLIAFGAILAVLPRTNIPSFDLGILSPSLGAGQFGPVESFAAFFSTLLVGVVVHELGHLLAGKLVGLSFVGLQIGPVLLSNSTGRLKLSLQKGSTEGFTFVSFKSVCRICRRLRVVIAGGPLANLLTIPIGYVLLASGLLSGFGFAWTQWFVYISAFFFVINLVPFQTRSGLFTDGARLKMLFFPSAKTYRWFALFAVGVQHRAGRRAKLWNHRWLMLANQVNDCSHDEFLGSFYAYLWANDSEDECAAASYLEHCLRLSNQRSNAAIQNLLFLEASVFQAWFRKSPENCLKWRNRVSNWKAFPWFVVLRAETALLCSQSEMDKALRNCEEAISKADTLPAAHRENFRIGWKEWKDKIQELSVQSPA